MERQMNRRGSPRVSAIIPFFNTPEPFLREAVASVLGQTSVALELLLVDDGSNSAISRVAREVVGASDGQVRYLAHADGRNRGISATRNLGVSEAQGEYVAFLDSDDVWIPGKLAEQLQILERTPRADMVFGLSEYWYDWSDDSGVPGTRVPDTGAKRFRLLPPPVFVSDFLRGRIIVPNPSNFMVRRCAYLDCGGFEESFPGMYEDQVFFAKLGLERSVVVVPRRWDRYRQHPGSVTAQARDSLAENAARRRFLYWLLEYCRRRRLDQPAVREAIAKELWLCKSEGEACRASAGRRSRWRRKWLLRLEELLVPARVRQRLWSRGSDP
jgi:glycosyltransferase involved in cell wall biosynthesis